jgi:hypothetical protein
MIAERQVEPRPIPGDAGVHKERGPAQPES